MEDKGEEDHDEIRATIIDHVVNHGLSERGWFKVQPNLQHLTVASIVQFFRQNNR